MSTSYVKLKKLSNKSGEVEFRAEIAPEFLKAEEDALMAEIRETFDLPGFRRGQVPEATVREHVDAMHLLEDSAQNAIRTVIADIVNDEKLDRLGSPAVTITKLAPGNPVEFTLKVALSPTFSLPDYKKIAATIAKEDLLVEVTDAQLAEGILQIQRIAAARMGADEGAPLPDLTPEFVRQLGPFTTVDDFKTELRKQLTDEQRHGARQLRRDKIVAEIVKKMKLQIPAMALDEEVAAFAERRDADLKAANITLEGYLKQKGKTMEEFDREEREFVENQMKARLALREIIKEEKMEAGVHETEHMLAELRRRYGKQDERELRQTAAALALQEKLFRFLEGEEEPAEKAP